MNCVVVLMTASNCEEYPGSPCIMEVIGPMSLDEAREIAAEVPEWTKPHFMILRDPAEYRLLHR